MNKQKYGVAANYGAVNYSGMNVTVMGLGLHGGGLESALYLAGRGARVTVTDLRDEKILAPSIEKLESRAAAFSFPIRYVLGRHETADFKNAGFVVKNPGARPDSPYLAAAPRIETDISIFIEASPARLTAVTGSKGKSSTAAALHHVLAEAHKHSGGKAWLGGNIAVSPLSFLDDVSPGDDVVLELSSWQLGDLPFCGGKTPFKPRAALITAILPDHLDRYRTMEDYVADKRFIYRGQDRGDITIAGDDAWGQSFREESPGRSLVHAGRELPAGVSGGWCEGPQAPGFARFYGENLPPGLREGETIEAVPSVLRTPGFHQKRNLLAAALALIDIGTNPGLVRESLGAFPGIEHRLEFFHEKNGVRFYNDTAATIPEAAAAAINALLEESPVIIAAGGSDKNLGFGPFVEAAAKAKGIVLLAGTGSDRLKDLLAAAGLSFHGPCASVDDAVRACLEMAGPGDAVVLSPGCASFGMFLNEFDRGRKWKEAVCRIA
ncbi:MAG: UDP-N-acetylmuramoyl-L-alanine--D-glutamate ligase [Treponema sp.]|jgi:UDP-N-acetylmuramoylalanine--D-glutamate ligase|nr:UDP-N-acetylmuramoyl-L-alanine--D-glutamate ligase [Treponema sp.]